MSESRMELRINDLANRIKIAREDGEPFVLILGAGASISSRIPPTKKIIENLVENYASAEEGSSLLDRFDDFWNSSNDDDRRQFLKPYLSLDYSTGYKHLADLIKRGYFRRIISFNFDTLLQNALQDAGCRGLIELAGGFHDVEQIKKQVEFKSGDSRTIIYQVHGSLNSPSTLKFSSEEMFAYEEDEELLLKNLFEHKALICGYSMTDFGALKSFTRHGGDLWWINPGEPEKTVKTLLLHRFSDQKQVTGELGNFDQFFECVHRALTRPREQRQESIAHNPFKFLASHRESDSEFLLFRDEEVDKTLQILSQDKPRSLHLAGKRMAGKTSFIRAGLLPRLKDTEFLPLYVRRCGSLIDETLPEKLISLSGSSELQTTTIANTLKKLCERNHDKHIVLILDQFERTITSLGERDPQEATEIFEVLLKRPFDNFTVLPVFRDDALFGEELYFTFALNEQLLDSHNGFQSLKPLSKEQVSEIVRKQAKQVEGVLDEKLLNKLIDLADQYDKTNFTLSHIETICHLFVSRIGLHQELEDSHSLLVSSLSSALIDHELLSYLEDLPIPEEQNLLRNILLAASHPSLENIAEYLKDNFRSVHSDQIWPPDPMSQMDD